MSKYESPIGTQVLCTLRPIALSTEMHSRKPSAPFELSVDTFLLHTQRCLQDLKETPAPVSLAKIRPCVLLRVAQSPKSVIEVSAHSW